MRVTWNGEEVKIQQSNVFPSPYLENKICDFVTVRMNGNAGELSVEFDRRADDIIIRPKSFGFEKEYSCGKVTVNVTKPCGFSIEPDGDINEALLVFVIGENKVVREDYENLIYFGPGVHYGAVVEISDDNTLVYVDDGAYVSGMISAKDKQHIAVSGGGVISQDNYAGRAGNIRFDGCRDVVVENVTLTDCWSWNCVMAGCDDVIIQDIHILGARGNSDGIDICGSRNVTVRNCFTRVWDDSLVVKAFTTGDVKDILFENCVLWNDFARPIEVGVELRADEVSNVCFRNIDIIHSTTGYPLMGIHHGDHAVVHDIRFENIRIEDAPGAQLFDIRVTHAVFNRDPIPTVGYVHDVSFENISVVDEQPVSMSKSRIQGMNEESCVRNVSLKGMNLCGYTATTLEELGVEVKDFVENVTIAPGELPPLKMISTALSVSEAFTADDSGVYHGKIKAVLENMSDVDRSAEATLVISPSRAGVYENQRFKIELGRGEKTEKEFSLAIPAGNYCVHLESSDPGVSMSWLVVDTPLVLGDDVDASPVLKFVDCRGVCTGEAQLAVSGNFLVVKSELLKNRQLTVYSTENFDILDNQVIFSVEETDSGMAPAIINGSKGYELAPQLRCPAEITYVFKNEPKVEKINKAFVRDRINGIAYFTLKSLGITDPSQGFRLELVVENDAPHRYPFSMFGSQMPEEICHMYARVELKK